MLTHAARAKGSGQSKILSVNYTGVIEAEATVRILSRARAGPGYTGLASGLSAYKVARNLDHR